MRHSAVKAGFRIVGMIKMIHAPGSLVDEQKAALFTRPAEDVPVLVSPWPESHPDGGILILSDSDDSDDYDDDDDDDIDME